MLQNIVEPKMVTKTQSHEVTRSFFNSPLCAFVASCLCGLSMLLNLVFPKNLITWILHGFAFAVPTRLCHLSEYHRGKFVVWA